MSVIVEMDTAGNEEDPDFGLGIGEEFIECMARINDEFIVIVKHNRLLYEEELSQREAS